VASGDYGWFLDAHRPDYVLCGASLWTQAEAYTRDPAFQSAYTAVATVSSGDWQSVLYRRNGLP
jgi:hypothetical protein